jgi:hypothetical protein
MDRLKRKEKKRRRGTRSTCNEAEKENETRSEEKLVGIKVDEAVAAHCYKQIPSIHSTSLLVCLHYVRLQGPSGASFLISFAIYAPRLM